LGALGFDIKWAGILAFTAQAPRRLNAAYSSRKASLHFFWQKKCPAYLIAFDTATYLLQYQQRASPEDILWLWATIRLMMDIFIILKGSYHSGRFSIYQYKIRNKIDVRELHQRTYKHMDAV